MNKKTPTKKSAKKKTTYKKVSKRKNPEKFNIGEIVYVSFLGPNIKDKNLFEKGYLIALGESFNEQTNEWEPSWIFGPYEGGRAQHIYLDKYTLLSVGEFNKLSRR